MILLRSPAQKPNLQAKPCGKTLLQDDLAKFHLFLQKNMSEAKRHEEDSSEHNIPLHILELFFGDHLLISRDMIESLLAQATKTFPYSLMKAWKCLRQLIEEWTKFQEQTMPNQEDHGEEIQKEYNSLQCGPSSYSQFLNKELCMTSLPPEMTEMLRAFVLKLLEDSN